MFSGYSFSLLLHICCIGSESSSWREQPQHTLLNQSLRQYMSTLLLNLTYNHSRENALLKSTPIRAIDFWCDMAGARGTVVHQPHRPAMTSGSVRLCQHLSPATSRHFISRLASPPESTLCLFSLYHFLFLFFSTVSLSMSRRTSAMASSNSPPTGDGGKLWSFPDFQLKGNRN